ncbi:tetratricopeptide repeat protein [Flavobacterium sp. RHBU_3]|uniref:tetratricopeptide repeat-containing sensor histidine kinase n=1 Tax=Flavobacterium sp. RHBU_3 TaxID=3391184 RepID=UPI0039850C1F
MKFLKIVFFLLFFSGLSAYAQNAALDKLFAELKQVKNDTTRVSYLNNIAGEYLEISIDKGREYALKAHMLAKRYKMPVQESLALINLGNAAVMQSSYPEALKYFNDSRIISEKQYKNKPGKEVTEALGMAYGSIGLVCNEQNDYPKALEFFFKALKLYKASQQNDVLARVYNGIGVVYVSLKEYDKALLYYQKSLEYLNNDEKTPRGMAYTNIGLAYLRLDNMEKSYESFMKAKALLNDSNDFRALGELYNDFGNYYRKLEQYDKAELYYKDALKCFGNEGYLFGSVASYEYLGNLADKKGKIAEALNCYQKSAKGAAEIGALAQVEVSEKAISELYEKQGDVKNAFEHYKKYVAAHDSLVNSNNLKALVREEMNFEFERKEAERKLEIEKKQVLYKEQVKRHRMQIIFTALFVVFVFGIGFLIYNRRQIKKTLTLQRDLAGYEQKALHLQMNPHFVFNCLGAISGFIVQNGTDSAIKYLSKFSKLMRLTLEYSKESLIPIDKEIESLQNYLELEQLRFNHVFDFKIEKDPSIEDDTAMPPLLVQPFVENAIMHGIVPKKEKGLITVNFAVVNDNLICTITDDGIGIAKSKSLKENSVSIHKSMALEITRKRLEVIEAYTSRKAFLTIESLNPGNDNEGTKITLSLPVQYLSDNK